MFNKAGNFFGMTTRSAARAGQGFAPRVLPQLMETSFGATSTPRNITSSSSMTSPAVAGSSRNTSSSYIMPTDSSVQFGRSYATRTPINDMDSAGDLAGSSARRTGFITSYTSPIYGGFTDIDLGNPSSSSNMAAINQKLTMRQRLSNFVKRTQPSRGGVTKITNPNFERFDDMNTTDDVASPQKISVKQRLINAFKKRQQ